MSKVINIRIKSVKKQIEAEAEAEFESRVQFKQQFINILFERLKTAKIDAETVRLFRDINNAILAIWAEEDSRRELESVRNENMHRYLIEKLSL